MMKKTKKVHLLPFFDQFCSISCTFNWYKNSNRNLLKNLTNVGFRWKIPIEGPFWLVWFSASHGSSQIVEKVDVSHKKEVKKGRKRGGKCTCSHFLTNFAAFLGNSTRTRKVQVIELRLKLLVERRISSFDSSDERPHSLLFNDINGAHSGSDKSRWQTILIEY